MLAILQQVQQGDSVLRSIFKFAVEIVTFPQGQQCKAEDETELEESRGDKQQINSCPLVY